MSLLFFASRGSRAEAETELNVEVAFSEQALTYRDNHQRLRVTARPESPDDKLPVSRVAACKGCLHADSPQLCFNVFI